MGARLTAFENRSTVEMEIRVFVPPTRPDRYQEIIRIKSGETKKVKTITLCCKDTNPENPTFLMVFMDGTYTGVFLLAFQVVNYAKIIGYLDENGLLVLKGLTIRLPTFCKLKFSLTLPHTHTPPKFSYKNVLDL
ncbi:hypothetical protein TEA_008909 [Camellia sinensis var. sinensis]|uniref:Uncharacterized protein n=1 Tax=Camellia sinensis var. sinensis TaxID=542762 RepID=A0A4S4D9D9_CAMSN|nr:hypothetical protein TEA_008909 [Camellia sinensis var. sinensis]